MKTNSLFKRLVSMLIVVLMICTLFPVTALAQPAKPTYDDLKLLLKVEIDCDTESEEDEDEDKHPKRTYDLFNNSDGTHDSFSVSKVKGNSCTVTVYSARYIDKYEDEEIAGEKFGPHSPEDDDDDISKTVTLEYKEVKTEQGKKEWKWCLKSGKSPKTIKFEVECEDEPEEVT